MSPISRRSFLVSSAILLAPRMAWSADSIPPLLDHVILGCSDLDRGIAFMQEHTGVAAVPSGVHPGRGTRNALLSLSKKGSGEKGSSEKRYLEILSPDPAQSVHSAELEHLASMHEPKLLTWAAHPGSIAEQAQRLKAHGVAFAGPTDGSRKRPDGRLLQWQTIVLKDDHNGLLPFFIEWHAETVHPSVDAPHGCRLSSLQVRAPDPAALKKTFQDLGVEVDVEQGSEPQLRIRIASPKGTIEITS